MKHLGLFEGIGGFSLAARWMGWETVAWCEWNEFCQKVLRYHFPEAKGHSDIRETDFTIYKDAIDIITGGFPCQPYSQAGKRKGKEDPRHLWPEMLRAIREVSPIWIVGENVFGLVNWSGGLVFEEVQSSLEAEGYEVQPYILPSAGVGAPHKRDRVWFVAYSRYAESQRRILLEKGQQYIPRGKAWSELTSPSGAQPITDAQEQRFQKRYAKPVQDKTYPAIERYYSISQWEDFPTEPPVRIRNDGVSLSLDGITFSDWCKESLKSSGNAIVPQVALQLFKTIEQYNQITNIL